MHQGFPCLCLLEVAVPWNSYGLRDTLKDASTPLQPNAPMKKQVHRQNLALPSLYIYIKEASWKNPGNNKYCLQHQIATYKPLQHCNIATKSFLPFLTHS